MKLNSRAHDAYRVVGMMSGTSMDGIDLALIETDGISVARLGPAMTIPYEDRVRAELRRALGAVASNPEIDALEHELTRLHADALNRFCATNGLDAPDLIGFHGHTIAHDPQTRRTWQIGDGDGLARLTGIPVAYDFRSADVLNGGEGAPLVPVFHEALTRHLERPLAVVNIGGVANVTWIGEAEGDLLAFDTGPGNAPLDDWALRHTGVPFDRDGALAAQGRADSGIVARFLADPYFSKRPPKSLDRQHFADLPLGEMAAADGAATLVACIAASIVAAAAHFPRPARRWIITGGGRHNPILMAVLRRYLGDIVTRTEAVNLNGDALEAQAFGYLAVRVLKGFPLSFPGTTGVPAPQTGGRLCYPAIAGSAN